MNLFNSCLRASQILKQSISTEALLSGVSDTIVVKHKDGTYKSTPFVVCFGSQAVLYRKIPIQLFVNNRPIYQPVQKLFIDKKGYLTPIYFNSQTIQKLELYYGKNTIIYKLNKIQLQAEVYLYNQDDKILVSDFDGTLTRNDIGGLFHSCLIQEYVHLGYKNLIESIKANGYKIIWITMRPLALYNMSKSYIQKYINVDGALLTQPEELLPAMKKQVLHKNGVVKSNLIKQIKQIFPSDKNPFIGGLGNKEVDAIAYLHAEMNIQCIFIVNPKSQICHFGDERSPLSYKEINQNLQEYFPQYDSWKGGFVNSSSQPTNSSIQKSLDKLKSIFESKERSKQCFIIN